MTPNHKSLFERGAIIDRVIRSEMGLVNLPNLGTAAETLRSTPFARVIAAAIEHRQLETLLLRDWMADCERLGFHRVEEPATPVEVVAALLEELKAYRQASQSELCSSA